MMAARLRARRVAVVLALSMSVSLLLAYSRYCKPEPDKPDYPQVFLELAKTSSELGPATACLEGVVTVQHGSRLGNAVMEYASAAAVARRHRLRLAIPTAISTRLSAIFGNLSAEPLSLLLERPPCSGRNITEDIVLNDKRLLPPSQLTTEGAVRWAQNQHLPVVLERWTILPGYMASCLDFLRQELRFRADVQRTASRKLEKIVSETALKTGFKDTQVCTVGVHVRRTDYGEYMRDVFHLQEEVGPAYYEAAAAAMLADLRDECAAVAFAVTSDDSQWCQQHLLPLLARDASEVSIASVGFLMSSAKAADDLCLLSSCQHLIMSYGTFGLTAAILSGGRTIMYDTAQHGAYPLPSAQRMTSLVPKWRLIS